MVALLFLSQLAYAKVDIFRSAAEKTGISIARFEDVILVDSKSSLDAILRIRKVECSDQLLKRLRRQSDENQSLCRQMQLSQEDCNQTRNLQTTLDIELIERLNDKRDRQTAAPLEKAYLVFRCWHDEVTRSIFEPRYKLAKAPRALDERMELVKASKRVELLIMTFQAKIERSAKFNELKQLYRKVSAL